MKNGNSDQANLAPFVMLDEAKSSLPLHRQIYEAFREAILKGDFRAKSKLPSTRRLATQLGVSRMTVIVAYDQLYAEGYLEGKSGSGTYVAPELPEQFLNTSKNGRRSVRIEISETPRPLNLSKYGEQLLKTSFPETLRIENSAKLIPFQHGLPAIDEFPFEVWSRIAQKWYKNPSRKLLGYGNPMGLRRLREAIAAHLRSTRGVRCAADQIIVTSGAQHALSLIAEIFLEPNDPVWIEDPCYPGAKAALACSSAQIIHVPVNRDGFDLEAALRKSNAAKLIYVTPSHQYPLGMTMSLTRRMQLLEWARENNAWIVEDDYNSEFRYAGSPLASLQGLDAGERVLYIGTFSKTVFPAVRLGCLVVPPDLVKVFAAARLVNDLHSPLVEQAILAEFITDGHFARHLRKMRKLYESRQRILVEAANKHLKGLLKIQKSDAGMHLVGYLPDGIKAEIIAEKALAENIKVSPVSTYSFAKDAPNALILGYTSFTESQIIEGVKKLAQVLRQSLESSESSKSFKI